MPRGPVDVVVPVAGGPEAVARALGVLRALELGADDTAVVVDNRGAGVEAAEVLVAAGVPTSYFARNAGAARGTAPWLVFLDADVEPLPGLLDAYFDPPPGERTGVLAGGIDDAPGPTRAARYAELKRAMDQETVLRDRGPWAFAQTANAAVRRTAFEAVGGFEPGIRSGGDADLCFRLKAAGWDLEERPGARVRHVNRATVPAMLGQRFRHGSGAAWLDARHPGSLPPRRKPGLALWAARRAAAGAVALARGDRDGALVGFLDGPAVWAFELGRLVPNRPARPRRRR